VRQHPAPPAPGANGGRRDGAPRLALHVPAQVAVQRGGPERVATRRLARSRRGRPVRRPRRRGRTRPRGPHGPPRHRPAGGGHGLQRGRGARTASRGTVPAGETVEGLMVFQAQRSADGRVLSLVYGTGPRPLRFEFPLQALVTAVPPPAPHNVGTAETAPS